MTCESHLFVRKGFTGYERDGETDLDFAQARFLVSKLGRFSSPDPLTESAMRARPQSFNRYVYVSNRPLIRTDPTGLAAGCPQKTAKCPDFSIVPDTGQTPGSVGEVWIRDSDAQEAQIKTPNISVVGEIASRPLEELYTSPSDVPASLVEPGMPSGYVDFNLSIPIIPVAGIIGGLMINEDTGDFAPYIGGGLMVGIPGIPTISGMFSPDSISGGLNVEVNGGYFLGGNVGFDSSGEFYSGVGAASPGVSLTGFWVFNVDQPRPRPLTNQQAREVRRNSASNVSPQDIPGSTPNCSCNPPR